MGDQRENFSITQRQEFNKIIMQQLISSTAAYKIFAGDKAANKLSHAYMLYYSDAYNLRYALKELARVFFGGGRGGREDRLIEAEGLPDLKIYPKPEKKLTVDVAAEIVDDAYLRPVEGDKKLYIVCGIEEASALFQNKLLKILEEPPQGVYFLLGATTLAPVLDTIISRVKTLEIPPFTQREIFEALERMGSNPENGRVSAACGGILGVAQKMLGGGWYAQVREAADEICAAADKKSAIAVALKYGEIKYKEELLAEVQRNYFFELQSYAKDENYKGKISKGAVVCAVESINKAFTDLKFNANFSSLLYDFALKVALENEKWSR